MTLKYDICRKLRQMFSFIYFHLIIYLFIFFAKLLKTSQFCLEPSSTFLAVCQTSALMTFNKFSQTIILELQDIFLIRLGR